MQDEDNQKILLCEITAIYGTITHDIFKLGDPKSDAEMVMELNDYPTDSLQYELTRIDVDQAYKNISPEEISKTMLNYCISRPFDEVDNMSVGRQELLGMAEANKAWEEAQCDDRQSNLWDAYYETNEAQIKKLLIAAKNAALEMKLYNILQEEDSSERQESYDELIFEFDAYCGLGERNK